MNGIKNSSIQKVMFLFCFCNNKLPTRAIILPPYIVGFFWGVLTILWLLNFRHFPSPNIRKWSCDTYHLQDSWMTLPWELSEWAFTSGNRMFLDLSNRGHLGFVLYTCFCSLIFRAVLMKENPALGLLCKLAIWRSVISRWTSLWGPMKSAPLFSWKQIKMALSGFWFFFKTLNKPVFTWMPGQLKGSSPAAVRVVKLQALPKTKWKYCFL